MKRFLAMGLVLALLMACAAPASGAESGDPASGPVPQAGAESFVFRNGITWGMSREEVAAAEGREGNHWETAKYSGLSYNEVKISQYSGHVLYAFSGDALQLIACQIRDAKQDAFDDMLNACDAGYGEGQEADVQELFSIILRVNPNAGFTEDPQSCTVRKWTTGSGTEIWMLWGKAWKGAESRDLMIYYVSPDFLNP